MLWFVYYLITWQIQALDVSWMNAVQFTLITCGTSQNRGRLLGVRRYKNIAAGPDFFGFEAHTTHLGTHMDFIWSLTDTIYAYLSPGLRTYSAYNIEFYKLS